MSERARLGAAVGFDVLVVVVFVLIGRRTHDNPAALAGLAGTAWPFLTGAAVGWLAARAWRHPWAPGRAGVPVWAAAVVVGLLLRAVSGQGTAPSFMIVTAAVLGVGLLGWRAAGSRWRSARSPRR